MVKNSSRLEIDYDFLYNFSIDWTIFQSILVEWVRYQKSFANLKDWTF